MRWKLIGGPRRGGWQCYSNPRALIAPLGCTDQVELNLELKPCNQPIIQRFQDLNPAMEEKLQVQIKTLLDEGVIETSKSPWSSPLDPVKKKDGSVRWTVYFRLLNHHLVMVRIRFPGSRICLRGQVGMECAAHSMPSLPIIPSQLPRNQDP